ncbi:molybdenum cofactor biosynthesis protein MoaE, partial [archaeon]
STASASALPSDPDWCELRITAERLDLAGIAARVTHPSAGGISIFVGTTRDHHGGKGVACLEYEAHEPLALAEMRRIAHEAFIGVGKGQLARVILHHRLGVVPVTESSVIIAVSSPHRAEALAATDYLIHRLKARVPVWKKEVYTDGTSNWKENCECAWSSGVATTTGAATTMGASACVAHESGHLTNVQTRH